MLPKAQLLKRGRKYFDARRTNSRGDTYRFHLLIDDRTKDLPLNTDLTILLHRPEGLQRGVMALLATEEELAAAGTVELGDMAYNPHLVEDCKKIYGQWDEEKMTWVFPGLMAEQVAELRAKYTDNPRLVRVTFLVPHRESRCLRIAGLAVARCGSMYAPVEMLNGAKLVAGTITGHYRKSKGSYTECSEHTTIEVQLPQGLVSDIKKRKHFVLVEDVTE